MLFLYGKNNLFFNVKNVFARFLQRNVVTNNKPIKYTGSSVYESTIINYYDKLQNLEKKLEIADKIRENTHKTIIRETAERIDQLRKTICDEKSDLCIVRDVATGLTISGNCNVNLAFVSLDDESNDSLKDLKRNMNKNIKTMCKLITNNKKLWDTSRDTFYPSTTNKRPYIELHFFDGTIIKIQIYSHQSLRKNNLLRYYTNSDPRYRKLYIYVRYLALKLNILNGRLGLLTGYQISVLVAYFLQRPFKDEQPVLPVIPQVCSPFVSPNLPIKEVVKNLNKPVDVSRVQFLINPKPPVSHLAIQFIDYFAEFDFLSNAMFLDKIDPVEMLQVDSIPKLQLFDPYSVKSISRHGETLKAFSESMKYVQNLIKDGFFIDEFLNAPGLKVFKQKLSKYRKGKFKS